MSAGSYLSLNGPRSISVDAPAGPLPPEGEERDAAEQKQEDSNFSWDNSINSAELAYILYQVPVLIGVHSAEMLPDECDV